MATNLDQLRQIPALHRLLDEGKGPIWQRRWGRQAISSALSEYVSRLRERIRAGEDLRTLLEDRTELDQDIEAFLHQSFRPSLRRVINATGIVLHTNLGRAPLAKPVVDALSDALGYNNLELDLESGHRGSRLAHIEGLLRELTGFDAALVVNNNAAAVLLSLSTLAAGREVIISRGQLVEIGGAFRVPDVIVQGGARLREVGTTNRTRLSDYEQAITEETAALLVVHPSNFELRGFTETVPLHEICQLGSRSSLPVLYDMGSAVPLPQAALPDWMAEASLEWVSAAKPDLVCFSGDKLLGGPQAGIILGASEWIGRLRKHPLYRALRMDKLDLIALEATLSLYRDAERALQEIPTLRALTSSREALHAIASRLQSRLAAVVPQLRPELIETEGEVGGGAMPATRLDGFGVALHTPNPDAFHRRLRLGEFPVLARIVRDRCILDVRTLLPGDEFHLTDAVWRAGTES